MPIHHVALIQLDRLGVDVLEADDSAIGSRRSPLHRLRTRILLRSVLHQRIQPINVVRRDPLRKGQIHGDLHRHTEFLHRDVGVRRNHRPRRELHPLALQIVADAPLLGTEPLLERLQWATGTLGRLGHTWNIVVHQRGDVILEERGPLINRLLLRPLGDLVTQCHVGLDDVNQFLGQIILRSLVVVLEDRGPNLRRRNRHHRADHPVGSAPQPTESHEVHILIADPAQQAVDILWLQEPAKVATGLTHVLPLCHNPTDVLIVIPMGLACTAAILRLLATPGHFLASRQYCLPPILSLGPPKTLGRLLVDEEFAALDAAASQDLQDHLVELDIVDRACQLVVTEVTGASMVVEPTGSAQFPIF